MPGAVLPDDIDYMASSVEKLLAAMEGCVQNSKENRHIVWKVRRYTE